MLRVQWSRGNVSHVSGGSREVGGAWRERRVKQFAGDMRVGVATVRWACRIWRSTGVVITEVRKVGV